MDKVWIRLFVRESLSCSLQGHTQGMGQHTIFSAHARRKTHQPFSAVKPPCSALQGVKPPSSALQGVKPPSSAKHADCCKLNQYQDASFKQLPLFRSSLLIVIHAHLTPKERLD